jgi:hypothetical protein
VRAECEGGTGVGQRGGLSLSVYLWRWSLWVRRVTRGLLLRLRATGCKAPVLQGRRRNAVWLCGPDSGRGDLWKASWCLPRNIEPTPCGQETGHCPATHHLRRGEGTRHLRDCASVAALGREPAPLRKRDVQHLVVQPRRGAARRRATPLASALCGEQQQRRWAAAALLCGCFAGRRQLCRVTFWERGQQQQQQQRERVASQRARGESHVRAVGPRVGGGGRSEQCECSGGGLSPWPRVRRCWRRRAQRLGELAACVRRVRRGGASGRWSGGACRACVTQRKDTQAVGFLPSWGWAQREAGEVRAVDGHTSQRAPRPLLCGYCTHTRR